MGYLFGGSQTFINAVLPVKFKLTPGVTSVDIAAGTFIETIVLNPVNADTITLGITPGGNEIEEAFETNDNANNSIVVNQLFSNNTTLYFTGVTDEINVTMYTR